MGTISGSDLPLTSEREWHPEPWAKLFLSPIRTQGNMSYSFGIAPKLFESGFSLAPSFAKTHSWWLRSSGWMDAGCGDSPPAWSSWLLKGNLETWNFVRILHSYSQNLGSLEQSLFILFNAYIFSVGFWCQEKGMSTGLPWTHQTYDPRGFIHLGFVPAQALALCLLVDYVARW